MFKYGKVILCSVVLNLSVFLTISLSYANIDKDTSEQKKSNNQEYSILSYNIENILKDSNAAIQTNIGQWYKISLGDQSGWVHKDLFPVGSIKALQEAKASAEVEVSEDKPQDSTSEEAKKDDEENSKATEEKTEEDAKTDVSQEANEEETEATEKSDEAETADKTETVAVLLEGIITGDNLNVRKGPGTNYEVITQMFYGDKVEILGKSADWYNIKTKNGVTGWVYGTYVSTGSSLASRGEKTTANSPKRTQIISYAKELLGIRYVYGGTTRNGFDCSGFVWYVFNQHGIKLNRVAADQAKQGTRISKSDLQPGDLVFFDTNGGKNYINHVGIYLGNGSFIHASSGSKAKKVVISDLNSGFYNNCYMTARKILD